MQIFDKKIHLREYVCSPTGGYTCSSPKVNLYIYASGFCPASCSFCPGFNEKTKIDIKKFQIALSELHNKQVINRIAITGGEPLLDLFSLDKILETIYNVCGNAYHISVNTNGVNLKHARNMEYFSLLNDIHISRHSDKDDLNDKIFGITTPTAKQIAEQIALGPNIFSLSCNLLTDHINDEKRLKDYLYQAIDIGVYQVGFVSLMEKTKLCKDLFVDYNSITPKLFVKDGFLFETMFKDKESCRCENFVYYNKNGKIPFYMRRAYGENTDCVKALIFNQNNNLITNFGKDSVLL
ncbi:Radical_SAM domain containing protein [uncultured Caudovirales phage]|uniref:Radical_SAM domain containing protein n=1 Tax=uncultured Caudovirales phage TaxID=2100421 RepID=A0A6J5RIR5_9CAUD|nr:Radical_SAM domain containing protein [uncultured Caudovirales phage]